MMITRQRRKSRLKRFALPLLAIGFLSYFGYHAFTGAFGIWAMDRLEADAARLTVERDRLKAEREAMDRKVAAVRPDSLDADAIDIQARLALNLMRPDEVAVPLGAAQQSGQ
jgi:cell division protein FtsB